MFFDVVDHLANSSKFLCILIGDFAFVIDTGDIDSIKQYSPVDAITNPYLVYAASKQPQYCPFIDEARSYAKTHAKSSQEEKSLLILKLFVNFGIEILKLIPGHVSTEVDARLSIGNPLPD